MLRLRDTSVRSALTRLAVCGAALCALVSAAPVRAHSPSGAPLATPTTSASPFSPHGGTRMAMDGPDTPSETEDLTQLSLEQLLKLDLVGIDVLGSHTHSPGEIMVGYRYMISDMSGYLEGDRSLGTGQVLKQFPTLHTGMQMEMHMLELMYAPSSTLTVMTMLPYQDMAMSHLRRNGERFNTDSSGIGDVTLMAIQTVLGDSHHSTHRLLFNGGLSIPTGSITQRDNTPTVRNAILEYPMQLGTGTVDIIPGLTYLGQAERWAWGAQVMANVPVGDNDRGYRFGNQYHLSGWASYKVKDWLAPTARLELRRRENVEGQDPELNPAGNPEANPKLQAGTKLYLVLGVNLFAPRGRLKGHRLNIEGGFPLYQNLTGPQLSDNWQITVGWTYTFQK